jgi:hypothetical protein
MGFLVAQTESQPVLRAAPPKDIGPLAGHFFPDRGHRWYANLKAYPRYGASNRPERWNLWLTLHHPAWPSQGQWLSDFAPRQVGSKFLYQISFIGRRIFVKGFGH